MRRIADVIYDERHVVVTLEGPGGLVLRELRSLVATASLTGDTDPTVLFPIPDAYTEYGLSVTVSGDWVAGAKASSPCPSRVVQVAMAMLFLSQTG